MENTCKVDKRIRRTKKILTEALIEILKEKNVMDVTVSELAKKADVTRTTFYQYYRDPVDMLEQLQDEIAEDIQKVVEATEGGNAEGFFWWNIFRYYSVSNRRLNPIMATAWTPVRTNIISVIFSCCHIIGPP